MPIPAQRDLEVARRSIADWLRSRRPRGGAVAVENLRVPGGTGFSNETLLFDATWTTGAASETEHLVIRVQPTSYRIFLEDDFETQYRVLEALGSSGAVRIAPLHGYEDDPSILGAPFFVMTRIEGDVPGDAPPYNQEGFLTELTPAERERLWLSAMDAFCEVHRVDHAALGLDFLSKPVRGATGLDQQLRYAGESFAWAAGGRPQPVAEAAWTWLQANLPDERPTALSWGDARIGNMIFRDLACQAVLDWEMVSLGGPELDLGWWLFLDRFHAEGSGLTRLEGLGSRQDTIIEWEARTGLHADNLEFYEVFAGFRFALVMIRIARMAVEWGMPESGMETNNGVTHIVARMLDLAPPGPPPF